MFNKIIAAILFIAFVAFFVGAIIGPVLLALCCSALWLLVYPVFFLALIALACWIAKK